MVFERLFQVLFSSSASSFSFSSLFFVALLKCESLKPLKVPACYSAIDFKVLLKLTLTTVSYSVNIVKLIGEVSNYVSEES